MAQKVKKGKTTEVKKYFCPYCERTLLPTNFYQTSDPLIKSGLCVMCKDCAKDIVFRYNAKTGDYRTATMDSFKEALQRLDKPWIKKFYERSLEITQRKIGDNRRSSVWDEYIHMLNLPAYKGQRWEDGEFLDELTLPQRNNTEDLEKQLEEEYLKNRNDVIRLIGYDPFEKEADEDKPLLYAQLIGYIDSEGNNDDMTRVLDSIQIVRGYSQMKKIDDAAAIAFQQALDSGRPADVRNYMDTKKKVADVISQLAEQSCISLKHNKNAKKGENTWTGKIKKLKDINLREAEVNGFDIGTCRGMQQVMDLSNASILKQLHLDESEYSDMLAEQRQMIVELRRDRDNNKELARILLRENLDLKDTLEENGLLDENNLTNLNELFSQFSSIQEDTDTDELLEEESGEDE